MSDSSRQTSVGTADNGKAVSGNSGRHKIFNAVGWLSFLLLAPPVLTMFNLPQVQDLLTANLKGWGSPVALVIYFYVILFLRVFFGSDQRYTPVFLGYIVSFLFFSISLDISFMKWLYDLSHTVPYFSSNLANLIAGAGIILVSNLLSGARKLNWIVDTLLLVVLPVGALVALGIFLPKVLGL